MRLADLAGFSPFHFHRIFSGMVGESVMAHVRRLRLERAAQELMHTQKAVIDVALDAGYETQESFTRAFRSAFDEPPARFRKLRRAARHVPVPSNVHYQPGAVAGSFTPLAGDIDSMNVRIEEREPLQAVFLRHVGPYEGVGETWGQLCALAGPAGLLGPQGRMFGLSYDDPSVTAPGELRYDACLAVAGDVDVRPPLAVQELPTGTFAVAIHEGPYEELSRTYNALCGVWLPQSGREPRQEPCMAVYLNDRRTTAPDDPRTEIWFPVTEDRGR